MERFWNKVRIGDKNECWEWLAGKTVFGYGSFGWRGGMTAHRASWILSIGEIPDNLCVLHRCDYPPCVNPHHLFLGTRTINGKDMWSKKRGRFVVSTGEQNGCAKLTTDKVKAIRRLYKRGIVTQRILGERFGVDRGTIKDILRGRLWRHLPGATICHKIGRPGINEIKGEKAGVRS